jgi:hypothetical protein
MKKYIFSILAIVLAVGFSAFSSDQKKPAKTSFDQQIWFDFAGGNESNLSLYSPDADDISDCPQSGDVLCEVLAYPIPTGQPNAGKPDFSREHTEIRYTP